MYLVSVVTGLVDRVDRWLASHRAPTGTVQALASVMALAFLFFAWLAPSAMPSGDAALYAQQARYLDFAERSVHFGYFAWAALFTFFNSSAPDLAFNLFSSLLAALTLGLIGFIVARLSGRLDLAVLAALSLCGSSTFLRQAVWAEVYIGQAFFFVLALWLFLLARAKTAGLALASSVLFSPSTLLSVPGLILARPRWRSVLALGLCGSAVVLAVLAFVWQDYFFGPRGLFGAQATAGGPAAAVVKEGFEVLFGVTALLPFLVWGGWALLRHELGRLALAVLGIMWALTFLLGERYPDVPVQLPTWILLAPILVAGAAWLEDKLDGEDAAKRALWIGVSGALAIVPFLAIPVVASRSKAFALLSIELVAGLITACVLAAALAFWLSKRRTEWAIRVLFLGWAVCGAVLGARLILDQNAEYLSYRQNVLELKAEAAVDYVAIGSWEQGILLDHYIYGRPYSGHTLDLHALKRGDESANLLFDAALEKGAEIWLLERDSELVGRLEESGRTLTSAAGFWVAPAAYGAVEPVAEASQVIEGGEER